MDKPVTKADDHLAHEQIGDIISHQRPENYSHRKSLPSPHSLYTLNVKTLGTAVWLEVSLKWFRSPVSESTLEEVIIS